MSTQNKDLDALNKTLRRRNHLKTDIVSLADNMYLDPEMDFVVTIPGIEDIYFIMSKLFEIQLAEKLGIPLPYFRRMKETNQDLLRSNVNGWLQNDPKKKYLIRGLVGEGTTADTARAFLSDSYNIIDDLRVLQAVQNSIEKSNREVYVQNYEISENRLYLNILSGTDFHNDVVAGFSVSNSETGQGAFEIRPRAVFMETGQSITINDSKFRKIHLGRKLKIGKVTGGDNTSVLLEAQIDQAINDFLNNNHLKNTVAFYESLKGIKLKYNIDSLQNTFKAFNIPEKLRIEILGKYMENLNHTSADIFDAISSILPKLPPDERYDVEGDLMSFLMKTKNYDKPA